MTSASTSTTAAADQRSPSPSGETAPCTLQEFLWYFLRLGTFGFGGPIALATLAVLSTVRKVPEPLVILVAGAVGLLLHWS